MVFLSVKVKDTSKLSGVNSQLELMFLHFFTEEFAFFNFTQIYLNIIYSLMENTHADVHVHIALRMMCIFDSCDDPLYFQTFLFAPAWWAEFCGQ